MPAAHSFYCFTHYPVRQETASGYYQLLAAPGYDAFAHQEAITRIRQRLSILPRRQQQICQWYFIDGYSHEAIARFTNLRPTTVKNHIAWSMIILRNYMVKPKAPV